MMGEYATLAVNMVDLGVFSRATTSPYQADAWRTPGYPAFLIPFYVTFHSWYPALFAQLLLLFLTAALLYVMAKRLMPEAWALVLASLYIVLPDTLLATSSLLAETLFTFLFIAGIYLCFFSEWQTPYTRFALAGILFALATYVRTASLYILVFFIPAYFLLYLRWHEITRKHVFAMLLLVLTFAGTLLPWCVRNERVMGVFSFATTGSYVLFRQNAAQFYDTLPNTPHTLKGENSRYVLEDMAGIPRGPVPTDFKYSTVMQKVAIGIIAAHPFRYALFHLSTFIPFFTSSGGHDYWRFAHDLLPNFDPPPEPSLIQAINPFSLPVLLTVLNNHGWFLLENAFWAIITLLLLTSLWYSKNVRIARMFFALILYFALVTGPIAHARYRMPVDPLLLLSSAAALSVLVENYRARKISIT